MIGVAYDVLVMLSLIIHFTMIHLSIMIFGFTSFKRLFPLNLGLKK
jgi:hypothetical protein